jgi:flagellar hook protein FlgE
MSSAFDTSIAGLNAQIAAIQVASNNIANASTVGYKARQSLFVDQYFKAVESGGVAGNSDAGTKRVDAQGSLKSTSSELDLAVQGNGMFCLTSQVSGDTATSTYYSRNGSFAVNKDGYIVNANGLFLNGYQPNATLNGVTTTVGALMMPPAALAPVGSTTGTVAANLDVRLAAPTVVAGGVPMPKPFLASDPSTYSASTTVNVFDAKGVGHQISLYFKKVDDTVVDDPRSQATPKALATASQFEVYMQGDGATLTRGAAGNTGSATLGTAADTAAAQAKALHDAYEAAQSNALGASSNYQSAVTATKAAVAAQDSALVTLAAVPVTQSLATAAPEIAALVSAASDLSAANNGGDASVIALRQTAFNTALANYSAAPALTDSADIAQAQPAVSAITIYNSATNDLVQADDTEASALAALTSANANAISAAEANAEAVDATRLGTLQFVDGQLLGSLTTSAITGNAATPTLFNAQLADSNGVGLFDVSLDLSQMTAFGKTFIVSTNTADGATLGALSGFSVSETGMLTGQYTNGKTMVSGQLALASFQAPDQLNAASGTVFSASSASGDPVLGAATSGSFGAVRSSVLEQSNTDMAAELVNLMILQRNYQANSQGLQAANAVMTTAINLGR